MFRLNAISWFFVVVLESLPLEATYEVTDCSLVPNTMRFKQILNVFELFHTETMQIQDLSSRIFKITCPYHCPHHKCVSLCVQFYFASKQVLSLFCKLNARWFFKNCKMRSGIRCEVLFGYLVYAIIALMGFKDEVEGRWCYKSNIE